METTYSRNNPLATEPIGKLIKKYSIPTALTLMVNYLYNIVDQIFIGQGVGVAGMAATNVAFPLTTVGMALALLLGDGCAANMSLMLGSKKQDEANQTVSQGLSLICLSGILFAVVINIFSPFLVKFLGATDVTYNISLEYMRITALGLPFLMGSAALAAIIRADGSPDYTMRCMILGAVINTVLDPIFIFVFKMDVKGAAIATVIGQIVSGSLCLKYMFSLKTVQIIKHCLIPRLRDSLQIIRIGIPSFITQIMNAAVQIFMNKHMTYYGAYTLYGSEIALSVYGMIMKVYQIAHSMFVGLSSATQPINGFNYGAGNYKRVYKTYRKAAGIGLLVSSLWFAVYQLMPGRIGMLFVADDPLFIEACRKMFRLYMLAFMVCGLHMPTTSFFQGIGKPVKSLSIPVVRQGLVLIPCSLILGRFAGLWGVLLSVPIADLASFILSLMLVSAEFKMWKTKEMI